MYGVWVVLCRVLVWGLLRRRLEFGRVVVTWSPAGRGIDGYDQRTHARLRALDLRETGSRL